MKQEKRFNIGERIFAKVRGYPPWPAKIENITDPNSKKNAKYHVVFYGTGEIGQCKIEDIYTYADNKSKFSKSVRRKQFHEGILELEKDLENFPNEMLGNISDFQPADNLQESLEDSLEKESESMVEGTSLPFGDSDAEAGALVIDESDKKKNLKRKSSIATPSTPENSALKSKRGKKSISGSSAETPFQAKLNDISQESLDEESEKKVSRSGRKIKPKRFHDSDAEITPDSQKIVLEQSKSKSKTKDEGTEIKEASISPPIKKRISGEIFNVSEDDKKYAKEDTSTKSQSRTKILRIEAQLLNWEHDIKASLLLDSANTEKCLEAMEKLLNLDITPLMLKKHPFVVETIKRLRVYIGNLSHWKLSPEETQIFNEKALLIQKKAEEIYDKFRKLFEIPPTQSFWELFMKEVEQFKSATKEMSQSQIFSLIVDPNTSGIKEKSITSSNKVFSENANISKVDSIEEDLAKQLDSDSETK